MRAKRVVETMREESEVRAETVREIALWLWERGNISLAVYLLERYRMDWRTVLPKRRQEKA